MKNTTNCKTISKKYEKTDEEDTEKEEEKKLRIEKGCCNFTCFIHSFHHDISSFVIKCCRTCICKHLITINRCFLNECQKLINFSD